MAARGKIRQFPTAYELKAIKRAEGGEGVLPVARKLYYGAVHLIAMSRSAVFRSGWFRPTLACFKNPPGPFLDADKKAIVSERPADALRGAQRSEQVCILLAGKQPGEIRKASLDRRQRGDAVVPAAQMRALAAGRSSAPAGQISSNFATPLASPAHENLVRENSRFPKRIKMVAACKTSAQK